MQSRFDDSAARRNVIVLMLAQAIIGAQLPISFILGGLSGQILAPNKCLATLPITMIVFASMTTAPWLSSLMQRHGRRVGFILGTLAATLGSGLCALGLVRHSFVMFLAGSFLIGIYQSAQGFFRFAATDLASPDYRPRAISWIMAAGLVPALTGPFLLKLTQDALAPVPFAGAYLTALALNLAGIGLFLFLREPSPGHQEQAKGPVRSRVELLQTPAIAVAMICAMVGYALMNLVMTSTPLGMKGCGFTTSQAADVVSSHVLAMFAPSFFTGALIVRLGVIRVIAIGLAILFAAGGFALAGTGLFNFYAALILLGIGWNFTFIGGTSLLAASHSPAERGRVQGMNDFAVFGMVTLASLSSGGLLNCSGGTPQQGWFLVNMAMIPFLVLAGISLAWYALWLKRPRS